MSADSPEGPRTVRVLPFTPGKTPDGWTETRTRERGANEWPHPENPGLITDTDGHYDWAGRRLFLSDGSPDPATPGAYRYQTRPDLCDPAAPDSEPVSPRYEPMWLRHKPGDTYQFGAKPFDPHDRGPFGNPLWRPDRRTGRHRYAELPDPIAPWDWQPGDPEPPDFARTRVRWNAHGDWKPDDDRDINRARHRGDDPDSGRDEDSDPDPDPGPGSEEPSWSGLRSRFGSAADVGPRRRWPWEESERRGVAEDPSPVEPGAFVGEAASEAPHRFSKHREEALHNFLAYSEPFAEANRVGWERTARVGRIRRTAIERECGPTVALFVCMFRWIVGLIRGTGGGGDTRQSERCAEVPGTPGPAIDVSVTAPGLRGSCGVSAARFFSGVRQGFAASNASSGPAVSNPGTRAAAREAAVGRVWRSHPRQLGPFPARPRSRPAPYIVAWEREFDSKSQIQGLAFGGAL